EDFADLFLDYLSSLNSSNAAQVADNWLAFPAEYTRVNKIRDRSKRSFLSVAKDERPGFVKRTYLLTWLSGPKPYWRQNAPFIFGSPVAWLFMAGIAWAGQSSTDQSLFGALVLLLFLAMVNGLKLGKVHATRSLYLHHHRIGLYGAGEYSICQLVTEISESAVTVLFRTFTWVYISGLRHGSEHIVYLWVINLLLAVVAVSICMPVVYFLNNPSAVTATTVGMQAFLMAYSGIYCNIHDLVGVVAWIPYVNPFYYGVSGGIRNEFTDTEYGASSDMAPFFDYSKTECVVYLIGFLVAYQILAWATLSDQMWTQDWTPMLQRVRAALTFNAIGSSYEQTPLLTPRALDEVASNAESRSFQTVDGPPVAWSNVCYTITASIQTADGGQGPEGPARDSISGLKKKQLLHEVSGVVPGGTLCAIMGPSGAGKTSLLEILGNRPVEGEVKGDLPNLEADELAFVTQEDMLEPTSTVLETLLFYAMLRLPPMRSRDYELRAEEIMGVLGLTAFADQMVGGASDLTMMKTLSGGQRRRVSIGCALMIDPKVIMLDEPTSGLDPFTALTVVDCMRKLTNNGLTCICSIHQPRIDIFNKFHQVMFLCRGVTVYAGPPTGEQLSDGGFKSILVGRDLARMNPADLIADWLAVMADSDLQDLAQTYKEKFSRKKIPKAASSACAALPKRGVAGLPVQAAS
ncbi:hypothetical protein CYMTET_25871, partial [Cymbomonas tetramitiformis]